MTTIQLLFTFIQLKIVSFKITSLFYFKQGSMRSERPLKRIRHKRFECCIGILTEQTNQELTTLLTFVDVQAPFYP